MDLMQGGNLSVASATAKRYVEDYNGLVGASTIVNSPPTQGAYAGRTGFIEVSVATPMPSFFAGALQTVESAQLTSRAVAGFQPTTVGAGIIVLDPSPPSFTVDAGVSGLPSLPTLPSLPAIIGGLEVLGLGDLRVDGAVLVNSEWGGVDQNGDPAGADAGPPYAISCTPLLALTKLLAVDIRAVGGVDKASNYGSFSAGKPSPLKANKLPVPDPFLAMPAPTVAADPVNVKTDEYGGVTVLSLLPTPVTLQPGVYDWIQVILGNVTFTPGVYIVRSVNPATGIALAFTGGQITADGVMFYITNSASFSPNQGLPDAQDGAAEPPAPSQSTLTPSVLITSILPGSSFTPINNAASPFSGMTLFQRRFDRRPIVVVQQQLLGSNGFGGAVYAKWGHVMLVGEGTFNASFVAGTMRVVTLLDCQLSPTTPLPPAEDVFLVE
jgi:hypothetical protein